MLSPAPARALRLKRFGRRAAHDSGGLAAVEFALIAPLMVLLYFGLAELSSAVIASRHTSHASSSLGDLVSQCSNINDTDLTNVFAAATDIMSPLNIATMNQRVSSVEVIDGNGTTQVQWSKIPAGQTTLTAYAPNTPVTLPANLVANQGDSVIMTETTYNFSFPVEVLNSLIKFDDLSYFKPRKSSLVTYTGSSPGGTTSQTSCYSS